MSGWISCDDVFERLTRGPFPSDADDSAVATAEFTHRLESADERVEAHLAVCHECRMLAEALRPAASELRLSAALRPGPERPLPIYRGRLPDLSVAAVPPEKSLADMPGRMAIRGHHQPRIWTSWPLALVLALGVVVGALAAGGWFERPGRSARQVAWSVGPIDPSRGMDEADAVLSSLRLQTVCWHPEAVSGKSVPGGLADERLVVANGAGHRCCTECHFVGSSSARDVDLVRLTHACVACHR